MVRLPKMLETLVELEGVSNPIMVADFDQNMLFSHKSWDIIEKYTGKSIEQLMSVPSFGVGESDKLISSIEQAIIQQIKSGKYPLQNTLPEFSWIDGVMQSKFTVTGKHAEDAYSFTINRKLIEIDHKKYLVYSFDDQTNAIVNLQRFTEEKASLSKQAIIDPLTGLHNRNYGYQELINHVLSKRNAPKLGLLYIDIAAFKNINDEILGHQDADDVLTGLGEYFQHAVRAGDYALRWGGEEFLILLDITQEHKKKRTELTSYTDMERALKAALKLQEGLDKIREEMRKHPDSHYYSKYFYKQGRVVVPRLSIGVDILDGYAKPNKGMSQEERKRWWDEHIENADVAMYFAKIASYAKSGRMTYEFYQATWNATIEALKYNLKLLCLPSKSEIEKLKTWILTEQNKELKPHPHHFEMPPMPDRGQTKYGFQVIADMFYFLHRGISPYIPLLNQDSEMKDSMTHGYKGYTYSMHKAGIIPTGGSNGTRNERGLKSGPEYPQLAQGLLPFAHEWFKSNNGALERELKQKAVAEFYS